MQFCNNFQTNLCHSLGPVKDIFERKNVMISLAINLNMCFGCSKVPSHGDGSFEYTQHMFWLRNKKINFQLCAVIGGLAFYY